MKQLFREAGHLYHPTLVPAAVIRRVQSFDSLDGAGLSRDHSAGVTVTAECLYSGISATGSSSPLVTAFASGSV